MARSKLDYPHPVLMPDGDDYDTECSFSVILQGGVQEDECYVRFELKYNLQCDCLEKLINEGKAKVVVYIESPNSSFRQMLFFPENEFEIKIQIKKDIVSHKITAKPYIIATEKIDVFSSEKFNPEYFENASFDIRKGDILAIEKQYDIVLENIDMFKNCASVFSIRLDEKVPDGVKVNYNDHKINIMVNKTDYEKYCDLREQKDFRCLLSSVLVFPALVEVIEAMKREKNGEEEGISEKRWFLVIEKQLKRKNISLKDMMSSVQIANELLGDILRSSLMSLDYITDLMKKGEET